MKTLKICILLAFSALALIGAETLKTVTPQGMVYISERGNERLKPLPDGVTIPANAESLSWDAATLTLSYEVPNPPDQNGDPVASTPGSVTLTAQQKTDADAWTAAQSVPEKVSPKRFRMALNQIEGLRAQVEAAVSAADQDTQDAWQYATVVRRDDAYVNALGTALGLTSDEIDDIFRAAALID